ncbi:MAG: FKBP-type peptidyl-prolyl cis-trans isomerase [Succinivibrionaceae bacterium]
MFKKFAITALASALVFSITGCGNENSKDQKTNAEITTAAKPVSELTFNEKASVALGQLYGTNLNETLKNVNELGVKLDSKLLADTFAKAVNGEKIALSEDEAKSVLEELGKQVEEKQAAKNKADAKANAEAGEKFLESNKTAEGVKVTESGLQYKIITEGNGPKPVASSTVKVNYKGTTIDGQVFDQSKDPVQFSLEQVIEGWKEGIQLLSVGSKAMLYVPAKLAYGEYSPTPLIKPNSTLIFEVELLEIIPQETKENNDTQVKEEKNNTTEKETK